MAGERALHLTKDIVLPLGVILALATFSFQFGGWKVEKDIKIAQALALSKASVEASTATTRRLDSVDRKVEWIVREQGQMDRRFDLFLSFTKGRIARLPWRAADAQ